MRALQIVDAKIVKSDPEHPVASYWAGEVLEGPAAEMQVALGHAYALPDLAAAVEVGEHQYGAPGRPQEAPGVTEAPVPEARADIPAPAEAAGGPVGAGQSYLVGEAGPESIAPAGSGA